MAEEVEPHLLKWFDFIKKVGSGAYGHVWKVQDKKTKQIFALKKVFDAFQHSTDAQRTYREVMFLQELEHPNIVELHSVFRADNEKDVYLLFEYMDADLHQVIRENILEEDHKRYIVHQILKALKYIHSGELIHRDLKPSNILLNESCLVKVCDFGLVRSCSSKTEDSPVMTEHVATRWYRAPEILLGSKNYDKAIDVWSLGCIVGELYFGGKPLFPGSSTLNQLERILQFTGRPSQEDTESIGTEVAENMLELIKVGKEKSAKQFFSTAPAEAVDLIAQMLTFNPSKRASVDQLLQSPYVQKFREKHYKVCSYPIAIPVSDSTKLSLKEYRNLIFELSGKQLREEKKKNKALEPRGEPKVDRKRDASEKKDLDRMERERQERKKEREKQIEQAIQKEQEQYKNQLADLQRKKQLLKDKSATNFRDLDRDIKNRSMKDNKGDAERLSFFVENKEDERHSFLSGIKRQNKTVTGIRSTYEKLIAPGTQGYLAPEGPKSPFAGYSAKSQHLLKQLYSPIRTKKS